MKKYLFLILLLPLVGFSVHKYYIALTEIEFKKETKTVQMIMNVFIDDIEVAINKEYDINAQLTYEKEIEDIDTYFKKYLTDHFKIAINNIQKEYNFIGKEYDGNILYFYLEIENISEIKSLDIENTIMLKYFPEQQNIIKVKNNEKSKSLFLTQKKHKDLLIF